MLCSGQDIKCEPGIVPTSTLLKERRFVIENSNKEKFCKVELDLQMFRAVSGKLNFKKASGSGRSFQAE